MFGITFVMHKNHNVKLKLFIMKKVRKTFSYILEHIKKAMFIQKDVI